MLEHKKKTLCPSHQKVGTPNHWACNTGNSHKKVWERTVLPIPGLGRSTSACKAKVSEFLKPLSKITDLRSKCYLLPTMATSQTNRFANNRQWRPQFWWSDVRSAPCPGQRHFLKEGSMLPAALNLKVSLPLKGNIKEFETMLNITVSWDIASGQHHAPANLSDDGTHSTERDVTRDSLAALTNRKIRVPVGNRTHKLSRTIRGSESTSWNL
jgi:hypothetical protein